MVIHHVLLFSGVKLTKCIDVLLVDWWGLALPFLQLCAISLRNFFSILQQLVDLIISKGQLPEHRVMLINFENLQKTINRMHAVLFPTTPTGTANFTAYLYLVLLLVGRLERDLSRACLGDQVVSWLLRHVIEHHEFSCRIVPVWSRPWHFS